MNIYSKKSRCSNVQFIAYTMTVACCNNAEVERVLVEAATDGWLHRELQVYTIGAHPLILSTQFIILFIIAGIFGTISSRNNN